MRQRDHLIPPLVVVTLRQFRWKFGEDIEMREFLVAVVAAVVIAVVAVVGLNSMQQDVEMAYHSSTGTRI